MAVSCLQVSGGPCGAVPLLPCLLGWFPPLTLPLPACSKTALLEGLEVDQYMLGILIYIQK